MLLLLLSTHVVERLTVCSWCAIFWSIVNESASAAQTLIDIVVHPSRLLISLSLTTSPILSGGEFQDDHGCNLTGVFLISYVK